MAASVGSDFKIEGTRPPSHDSKAQTAKDKETLLQGTNDSEEALDITLDDKPLGTTMPALETFKETLHRKDNKALEVLLRIRRFHVTSALKQSTENSLSVKSSSLFAESYSEQGNTDSCESIEAGEEGSARYESIKLPTLPFSTVLKGQRLSVGGKEKWKGEQKSEKGEPKERHTVHVDQKLREKGKIVILENNKMKSPAIKKESHC
ncbi:PREDICTED: uncharacterized protein LOC107333187 [Acropora digitifera]|uniref:uncharacterized protein LOC107333187 n=1 Tax=Acropora digitifera TaxID=70779 RepID=UPI00077A2161|nr:PREDICTED: uncharacterized protein LOC107333187 [Acropora digitifera]